MTIASLVAAGGFPVEDLREALTAPAHQAALEALHIVNLGTDGFRIGR